MYNPKLTRVVIVDYKMGNLFSVKQACEFVGLEAIISSKKDDILNADAVILPGVGAFGNAIATLNKLDLVNSIIDAIKSGKPFMGICLGMQLLFSESEEFGKHKGLGVIPGAVIKFPPKNIKGEKNKVPQVGWNRINKPLFSSSLDRWLNSPLADIKDGEFMYFVHSYYCKPENNDIVFSVTEYCGLQYSSSILWRNIFACQFHPEKSAQQGLRLYKNWSLFVKEIQGNKDDKKIGS